MVLSREFVNREKDGIALIQCGEEDCSPRHEFGGVRTYYLLHVIRSGKGEFSSGGKKFKLGKGEAFLIFPNEKHLYKADSSEPWNYFWLAFDGDLSRIFRTLLINLSNPVFYAEDLGSLYNMYRKIFDNASDNHPSNLLESTAYCQMILASLFRNRKLYPFKPPESTNIKANHVKSMIIYISTYYNTPIRVSDVIDFVHLERSYASKLFKSESGLSIGKYLQRERMNKAKIYLKQGMTVKETAYSVGYSDYETFLKTFKRSTGLTPSQFCQISRTDALPVDSSSDQISDFRGDMGGDFGGRIKK